MTEQEIRTLQQQLLEQGFYTGKVDGIWGPLSKAALEAQQQAQALQHASNCPPVTPAKAPHLAWGAKVSTTFRDRVQWIADDLNMPADGANWLMACMAFESGETFSPSIVNGAGSGATGLIQFMPKTAIGLGTTVAALAQMTAEDQLNYVYKYFRPYRGRLRTLADVYMAILWPAAVGKPDNHILWTATSHPTTYRQNAGLDINRDTAITKGEAASKVADKLRKGLQLQFVA